ncbi:MAG: HNH endonuclease signature motif containing protein [Pseudomonadales bacterium]
MQKPLAFTPLAERRFWEKVDKSGDCWIWTASKNAKGYGQLSEWQQGKRIVRRAHRVAYELTYGAIPEMPGFHGACVLHRCDNPACVNPSHLFLGTNAENVKDMDSKGRRKVSVKLGSAHKNSVLTEDQVREIAHRHYEEGTTQLQLSREYAVAHSTINHIFTGRLWAHLGLSRKARQENL